jgi:hypothetical protein
MAKLVLTSDEEIQYLHILDKMKEVMPDMKVEVVPDIHHHRHIRNYSRPVSPIVRTRSSVLCEVSPL